MATIKFILQGKSAMSNITVRFIVSKKIDLKRKTGLTIDVNDWSEPKKQPIPKNENLKRLKSKLDKLQKHIETAYNDAISNGVEITGDWLQLQIDINNNKIPIVELDVLTNYIQKYIDEAPYKQNQKKQIGLSTGRIQNLKLFKATVKRYEAETPKGKSILIKDINLQFVEKFKIWLFGKGYSVNYVGKNIANLRTICIDASKNDIETSVQIKNIKGVSESKEPEDIVFLNEQEQEAIKKAPLIREALINARKWLLLGCLIGQRGGDLLSITAKNIKDINGIKIIELKQQKTGKLVAIPLLPEALEIIENGLPYKISLANFNEYIKDVCKEAELFMPTKGRKKLKQGKPTVKDVYPKHEIISSHICRRSFATNFYGRIPTPVLMNITAHGSERMFLHYIGKTTYDNAYQMLEYFSKLTPKTITPPVMEVIRNTGDQKE
ncbi:phage integrase SAM-like domain-containing protein [Flavobacterium sp. FZUC8N2.13]|uniref:Phage integrase SAM-like domain-containing protein n=1 Tax=Flavobacterium zubiriense TaxID=3138075 RepID=A0ABV4TDB2_9FLAO